MYVGSLDVARVDKVVAFVRAKVMKCTAMFG
jgi:hypothetical protein